MVAVLEIGAFCTSYFFPWPTFHPDAAHQVTSLAAGRVGDIIGRKRTLFTGAVVFTIGGAIQTLSVGFWSMVVGRIVSGCGVGLLSCVDLSRTDFLVLTPSLLPAALFLYIRVKSLLRTMYGFIIPG